MKKETRITNAAFEVIHGGLLDGNVFLIRGPRVAKEIYREIDAIMLSLGGKWESQAKGHVFREDPSAKIQQIIESGTYLSPRDCGYFPTPGQFAKELVIKAEIGFGMKVLEPSAGKGRIAWAAAQFTGIENVAVVELLDANIEELRKRFPHAIQGDFLKMVPNPLSQFDRIVMNPPFRRHIAHVRHAWRFLKPGGRLVTVMAAGITDRDNLLSARFRTFANQYGTIERNPAGSFKESGTMVETVTVILNKP